MLLSQENVRQLQQQNDVSRQIIDAFRQKNHEPHEMLDEQFTTIASFGVQHYPEAYEVKEGDYSPSVESREMKFIGDK